MKRQFQNLNLQCWEHASRLGVAQPTLCVQGDSDTCDVLLAAIDELISDGPPATRRLTLIPGSHPDSITTIRLVLTSSGEDLRQMSLTRDGSSTTWEFTEVGIKSFREAVVLWRDGSEDFSLHPIGSRKARHRQRNELGLKDLESGELWFWTPRMEP